MLRKQQSVVSLDPIDRTRKKQDSFFGRLLKTRWSGGKPVTKTEDIGMFIFEGKQRQGKTTSMLWFAEQLYKKYAKKGKKVIYWSNMGFGNIVNKHTLLDSLVSLEYDPDVYHIFILDEVHSYFPKDTKDKYTLSLLDSLVQPLSQLGKVQCFILCTAQVYGRINKTFREQALYMVHCRPSKLTRKTVSDFIDGDDVLCDDLGRWSGVAKFIRVHGLPEMSFDTHAKITE